MNQLPGRLAHSCSRERGLADLVRARCAPDGFATRGASQAYRKPVGGIRARSWRRARLPEPARCPTDQGCGWVFCEAVPRAFIDAHCRSGQVSMAAAWRVAARCPSALLRVLPVAAPMSRSTPVKRTLEGVYVRRCRACRRSRHSHHRCATFPRWPRATLLWAERRWRRSGAAVRSLLGSRERVLRLVSGMWRGRSRYPMGTYPQGARLDGPRRADAVIGYGPWMLANAF